VVELKAMRVLDERIVLGIESQLRSQA